jgi:hypothetical protein
MMMNLMLIVRRSAFTQSGQAEIRGRSWADWNASIGSAGRPPAVITALA